MPTRPSCDFELVVSRYCEDLGWVDAMALPTVIYDKSSTGPRQRIHLPGWSSADGPSFAALWPGAIALPNHGCESHSHMVHILEHWDDLADRTVFLSGDAPVHRPFIHTEVEKDRKDPFVRYRPYGDPYTCDAEGRPHADHLPELREAFAIFYPGQPMPETFTWHGFGMYMVGAERIQRFSRAQWEEAERWCRTKACSLGMERLYDRLFA